MVRRRNRRITVVIPLVPIVQVENIVAAVVVVVILIPIVVIIKHLHRAAPTWSETAFATPWIVWGVLMDSIGIIGTSDGSGITDNKVARFSPW